MSNVSKNTDGSSEQKESKQDYNVNFLQEKDVFKLLLSQMHDKLIKISEQEITIIKAKTSSLLKGEEKERERISRELHDGIGQMLTAIKLMANSIQGQDELKMELKKMVDETISETRRISFNLMPSVLLNFGLSASVKTLCENAEKYSGIRMHTNLTEELNELDFDKKVPLYRLIQEAINNTIKHSGAKNIFINILKQDSRVKISVKDDGSGFNLEEKKKNKLYSNKGLANMAQRAELCGGNCSIHSEPGKGTIINIDIPLT